jgi:hypothetical protein
MENEEVRLLAEDDPILEEATAPLLPRTVREFMCSNPSAHQDPDGGKPSEGLQAPTISRRK